MVPWCGRNKEIMELWKVNIKLSGREGNGNIDELAKAAIAKDTTTQFFPERVNGVSTVCM